MLNGASKPSMKYVYSRKRSSHNIAAGALQRLQPPLKRYE